MKLLITLVFTMIVGYASAQVDYTHKTTGDLTVTIKNIDKFKGVIMIGLYNSDSTWLQMGKEYRSAKVEITATTVTYVFKDLPFGTYAISVFHDKNSDGECNRNWVGIPAIVFRIIINHLWVLLNSKMQSLSFLAKRNCFLI
jgi:uncharacterized protein (DUF2141 family)